MACIHSALLQIPSPSGSNFENAFLKAVTCAGLAFLAGAFVGETAAADEAEAALDSIPAKLAQALKAVNVESKCVRDQVRGIIEAAAWGK